MRMRTNKLLYLSMKLAITILRMTCWLSMLLMIFHGIVSPIVEPVYLKMEGVTDIGINPWLMTPPALLSAFGCKLLLNKNILGYPIIVISALLGLALSPNPYAALIPLFLVSIPFFFTVYHATKKI